MRHVTGLTEVEAERRLAARGSQHEERSSRSYRSIAIANTFTIFNLILAVFGAATIAFGNPRDALFLGILFANIGIGTFQEVRAKRALDKLAALIAELTDPQLVSPDLRAAVVTLGDCSADQCIIDADFLGDVGFKVVAPHRYFPRMRLELEQGLGWKADVEAALERLLASAQLQQPVGAGASPCS